MFDAKKMSPDEIMKLAENIYEGLSEEDINEIEKIALDRSNFFSNRDLFFDLEQTETEDDAKFNNQRTNFDAEC